MVRARSRMLIRPTMMEPGWMVSNRGLGSSTGVTARFTMESSRMEKCMARGSSSSQVPRASSRGDFRKERRFRAS